MDDDDKTPQTDYTLENGTLKYTNRVADDYFDIRFYYDETKQDLTQDSILSYKVRAIAERWNLALPPTSN